MATSGTREPIHPGFVLRTEFLEPLGITAYALGRAIGVDLRRVYAIVKEERTISVDTGLRLSRALGVDQMYWINLQARYDAQVAAEELTDELNSIECLIAK
ncbi:addiction module antidote protein, HigA family [Mycobacteroides chelonae]|uniref:Addiction module antidote protein, HigA family n=1 Tax=Mycobacteroides chelonae TaxID=1774 RepID=A0A1S1LI36_MYCCH|nr:HigA family addiction module antitoxin [Mycobacteroides chelonae]OHU47449.1 addiction module antidote protein, HigA family [Mycobacteroides chelonae]